MSTLYNLRRKFELKLCNQPYWIEVSYVDVVA